MNKITYNKNYILFNLNNGDKKAFLAGTIRHYVNGSSLSFYLLDNEVGELPVVNVNYNQTIINGIQITDDNIDTIFEDLYNYDIFEIIDFSLVNDILTLVTSEGEYEIDLSKYNYDTIIDIINDKITDNSNKINEVDNKLDIEITRSKDKDEYLEYKINAEIIRSTNADNELLNNINTVNSRLSDEITRSTAKDTEIETNLNNEIIRSTNTDNELLNNINTVNNRLGDEITRSTAKDTEIEANLSNEIIRAKEAESKLDDKFDEYYTKGEVDTKLDNIDLKDYYKKGEVDTKLATKVDKEAGKGLSTNDYTTAEKTKLAGLHNYDDTVVNGKIDAEVSRAKAAEAALDTKINTKVSKVELVQDAANQLHYTLLVDSVNKGEINIPKDQFLKSANYDSATKDLVFVFVTSTGETTTKVSVADLVDEYTAGNGLTLANNVFSIDTVIVATKADLAKKADKADTYNKGEVDDKIDTVVSGITSDLKNYYTKGESDTKLSTKVDKEAGKGLSANDYTTAEKTKLAGLHNYDDTAVNVKIDGEITRAKGAEEALGNRIDGKQDKLVSGNNIKTVNGNSLLGSGNLVIDAGVTDVYTRGEVDTKLATKVDKISGKGLSTNDYTAADKTKVSNTPNFVTMTFAEYTALSTKDNNTLYIIIG